MSNLARSALVSLLALSACDRSSKEAPEPVTSAVPSAHSARSAAPAPTTPRMRRDALRAGEPTGRWRGRPERLLTAAVEQAAAGSPEKQQLEALIKRLDGGTRAEDKLRAFRAELAESARTGSLDTKKLEAAIEEIEQAGKAAKADSAKLLNELHRALDATRRKAVVDAVRKEQQTSFMQHKAPPPAERDKLREERERQRVERLARELELNEEQSQKLAQIEAKWRDADANSDFHAIRAEGDRRLEAVLTAFEKGAFDASRLELVSPTLEAAPKRARNELERVKATLPLLNPEQRSKYGEQMGRIAGRPRAPASGG
jgi:hypothetical protein